MRRPRFFWTSHSLELISDASFEFRSAGTVIQASGPCEPVASWLPVPWEWPAVEHDMSLRFPDFTPCFNKSALAVATATCDSVSGAVETRWKEDACRFSVDTYLDEFLVTSASAQRILCAAEREALLGFPKSHTRPILKQVGGQAGETARLNLVGRAPHCASVACILLLGLPAAGCQHVT